MMDGRQMIRALFLDVDGTIISTRTKKIPESASEAIRDALLTLITVFSRIMSVTTGGLPAEESVPSSALTM